MKTEKRKIGDLGEGIACMFLVKRGFSVSEKNYLKKCGEIDVIVEKEGIIHFVEVKTVSRENIQNVSHETDSYRPEDNLHPWKLKRLSKTIQTYLMEKNISDDVEWKFDVVVVFLDIKNKTAKVRYMENIIL